MNKYIHLLILWCKFDGVQNLLSNYPIIIFIKINTYILLTINTLREKSEYNIRQIPESEATCTCWQKIDYYFIIIVIITILVIGSEHNIFMMKFT